MSPLHRLLSGVWHLYGRKTLKEMRRDSAGWFFASVILGMLVGIISENLLVGVSTGMVMGLIAFHLVLAGVFDK